MRIYEIEPYRWSCIHKDEKTESFGHRKDHSGLGL